MKHFIFIIMTFLIPLFLFGKAGYHEPWGKDSSLMKKTYTKEKKPSGTYQLANTLIQFHQKNFSPIDGPRSSFRPTSSRYMQLAMQRYGTCQGFFMGCDRLLRENSETWVYQTRIIDGITYKFDPAIKDKFSK